MYIVPSHKYRFIEHITISFLLIYFDTTRILKKYLGEQSMFEKCLYPADFLYLENYARHKSSKLQCTACI